METNNMQVDLGDKNIEDKLKSILEEAPVELIKDLLSKFYTYRAQQCINDRKYQDLQMLEGLTELHNLVDRREF